MNRMINYFSLLCLCVFKLSSGYYEINYDWMKDAGPVPMNDIDQKINTFFRQITPISLSILKLEQKISEATEILEETERNSDIYHIGKQIFGVDQNIAKYKNIVLNLTRSKTDLENHQIQLKKQLQELIKAEIDNINAGGNKRNRVKVESNDKSITFDIPHGRAFVTIKNNSPKCVNSSNVQNVSDANTIECGSLMKVQIHNDEKTFFPLELRRRNGSKKPMIQSPRVDYIVKPSSRLKFSDHDGTWGESRYRVFVSDTTVVKNCAPLSPDGSMKVNHTTIDKIQNDTFISLYKIQERSPNGEWVVKTRSKQSINLNDPQKIVNLKKPCVNSLTIRKYTEARDLLSEKVLVCNNE